MKLIVVFAAFIVVASAAKIKKPIAEYFADFAGEEDIHLITEDDNRPPSTFTGDVMKAKTTSLKTAQGRGKFNFNFETENGINVASIGKLRDDKTFVVSGSYTYTGANGKRYRVRYTADEFGYHPVTELDDQPEVEIKAKPTLPPLAQPSFTKLKPFENGNNFGSFNGNNNDKNQNKQNFNSHQTTQQNDEHLDENENGYVLGPKTSVHESGAVQQSYNNGQNAGQLGSNGQQGFGGQQGINGQGFIGQQGLNGQQGFGGQQGINGQHGVNAQGFNGQQGFGGQQGFNGQQGVIGQGFPASQGFNGQHEVTGQTFTGQTLKTNTQTVNAFTGIQTGIKLAPGQEAVLNFNDFNSIDRNGKSLEQNNVVFNNAFVSAQVPAEPNRLYLPAQETYLPPTYLPPTQQEYLPPV